MDREKVVFLTGAARGLGFAIAEAVLEAGYGLVATSKSASPLSVLKEQYGEQIRIFDLDVRDEQEVAKTVQSGIASFGKIDVVINNAGYSSIGSVEDTPLDVLKDHFDTNFFGSVFVLKSVIPHFRAKKSGQIIQVSSIADRTASAGAAHYYATKSAITTYCECLRKEIEPFNIKLTIAEPGSMRSDFATTSMRVLPYQKDYELTVGAIAHYLKDPKYKPRGDVRKIARLLVGFISESQPPVRLLIGTDAFVMGTTADQNRLKSDELYEALSLSTDADDAGGFSRH